MDEDINIKSTKKSSYSRTNLFRSNETYSADSHLVHDKNRCTESKQKLVPSTTSCARLRTVEQIYMGSLEDQMPLLSNVESTKLSEKSISSNRKQRCRDTNVCTSSSKKRGEDLQEKEQESVANMKAQVKKIVNDVEVMLATYTSQVGRLQVKYLEADAFMVQDIEDIMFIVNCVLSNLMKELTEKQHYLTDYFASWSNLQKQNNIRPEFLYHHCNDGNNLQSENDNCPGSSRCAEVDSANAYKQQSCKVMQELSKENDSGNRTIPAVHSDVGNDKSGSLSVEVIKIMSHDHQRNHNDELQRDKYIKEKNKAALPSVDKISKRTLTEACVMSNGTVESEDAKGILSNAGASDQNGANKLRKQVQGVSDSRKENPAQAVEQLNDDSDLCSTCSTILLQSVLPAEADNKKLKDTRKKKDMRPQAASTPTILIELSDTNEESRSSSCSSDETYFSPHHKNSTSSKQDTKKEIETSSRPVIRTRRILRKNENPLKRRKLKSVSDVDTLRRKYYFEAAHDKNTKYSKGESHLDKDLPKKRRRKAIEKKLLDCEIVLERMDK